MRAKKLLLLTVVAVILVGGAVLTSRKGGETVPTEMGKLVLGDLPVNDVAKIVLYSSEGTTTVERVGETWVTPSRYGYPVDFSKVKKALLKLADLKVAQVMRVDDQQRAALGMLSPLDTPAGETNGIGRLVVMHGADGVVAQLLVGSSHYEAMRAKDPSYRGFGPGQYVSADGGKTVYMVSESFYELAQDAKEWVVKDMLDIKEPDITAITLRPVGTDPILLTRPEGGGSLTLDGLAEDEELQTTKVSGVASALSYLRFNDIADPALPDADIGMAEPYVIEATVKGGGVYTLSIGGSPEDGEDRYVRIQAAMRAEPMEERGDAATDDEGGEDGGAAAGLAEARAKAAEAVSAAAEKLGGWTYLVASHRVDSMTPAREDLAKVKVEEEEGQPAGAGEAPAAAEPAPPPAQPQADTGPETAVPTVEPEQEEPEQEEAPEPADEAAPAAPAEPAQPATDG